MNFAPYSFYIISRSPRGRIYPTGSLHLCGEQSGHTNPPTAKEKNMKGKECLRTVLFIGCVLFLHCAAGIETFKGPTGDRSYLVIGSILFQSNYLGYKAEVCRKGIEVAILGRIEEMGKVTMTSHWTTTDQNGYFFLADVAPGQYAVKGIRLTLSDGTRMVMSSPLRLPGSMGFQLQNTESIVFEGDHFPHQAKGRIINLQHHYFTIDRTLNIGHTTQESAEGLVLITGERIDLPKVQEYFIVKYPDSKWIPLLKESLKQQPMTSDERQ